MRYCSQCGSPMEDTDGFCSRCGAPLGGRHPHHPPHPAPNPEPIGKLGCELAYIGTLFWLPLLVCPKEKLARRSANQGLWILILSTVACVLIRLLGSVNSLLAGSIPGIIFGAFYALAFLLFLGFMFYLAFQCVRSALAIHRGETPDGILFFDRLPIIR